MSILVIFLSDFFTLPNLLSHLLTQVVERTDTSENQFLPLVLSKTTNLTSNTYLSRTASQSMCHVLRNAKKH
jgi:hypothetical protein